MSIATILWRRLDRPGHEAARLEPDGGGWALTGTSAFASDGAACSLAYRVACDAGWRTVSAVVSGWIGADRVEIALAVGPDRTWRLNGATVDAATGCLDVDLNFSPSTNLLPIRRLGLAVGEEAAVRAAWLRFPSFTLEPLDQVYRRTGDATYRYESGGGRFVADLDVTEEGFVSTYPGFFAREP
jgi:hypothetical protein